MKNDILLIAMLPWIISLSNVRDWVAIIGGMVSIILMIFKIIDIYKNWNKKG